MAKRSPTRPDNQISQTYNDGNVTIYGTKDIAAAGYAPKVELVYKGILRYAEQRLGINRLYLAKQANVEISRVLRTSCRPEVSPQDVAVTEDGQQYRIESVQIVQNVWPKSMDISLVRVTEKYEV